MKIARVEQGGRERKREKERTENGEQRTEYEEVPFERYGHAAALLHADARCRMIQCHSVVDVSQLPPTQLRTLIPLASSSSLSLSLDQVGLTTSS